MKYPKPIRYGPFKKEGFPFYEDELQDGLCLKKMFFRTKKQGLRGSVDDWLHDLLADLESFE